MPKECIVRARVDAALKARASAVLIATGYTMSDLVREALESLVREAQFPFSSIEQSGVDQSLRQRLEKRNYDYQKKSAWIKTQTDLMEMLRREESKDLRDTQAIARIKDAMRVHRKGRYI